jgi:hypothetical protein
MLAPRSWLIMCVVPLLTAAVLLLAGELWCIRHPVFSYGIDEAVLQGQMDRAAEGVHAPLLLTGDSSGLVGVDAPKLAATLGISVQSLSTMGNVGPAGWGGLLERDRRGGPPDTLVLLVHGDATQRSLPPNEFEYAGVHGVWPVLPFGENLRRGVLYALGYLGNYPLPGPWGRDYGSAAELERRLDRQRGTIADPTIRVSCPQDDYQYHLSDSIGGRLPVLAKALQEAGAKRLMLGITPIPQRCTGPSSAPSRDALAGQLADRLGIDRSNILPIPMALPDRYFAGFTHLNVDGRKVFTQLLADALAGSVKPN